MVKSGDIVFLFDNNTHTYDKKMPTSDIAIKIYETIKAKYEAIELINLIDFGGVAEHFLGGRGETDYIENPPKIKQTIPSFIFSFLPSNQKFEQSTIMHETGIKSGFIGTIITTKKFGKKGKSDLASELSKLIHFNYYDDTSSILDEFKEQNDITTSNCFWVQPNVDSEFHDTYPNNATIKTITISDFLASILE